MKAGKELRALELDLSDSNVVVGVDKRMQYDLVRFLISQGVRFDEGPKTSYARGEVDAYMRDQIGKGRNYLLVDGSVAVDSNLKDGGRNVSVLFNLYQTRKEPDTVYLEATHVRTPRAYQDTVKIKSSKLDNVVKSMGASYPRLSERYVRISEIPAAAKAPARKVAEPPAPVIEPERKVQKAGRPWETELEWEDVVGKMDVSKWPRADKIVSPRIKMVPMEGFGLDGLEKNFFFPGFQRKTPRDQAIKILKAMVNNEYEGAIVKTMWSKERKMYEVDDGKTTLLDLKAVRDHFGVQEYNIYNLVYQNRKGNELFIRLNDGQPVKKYDWFRPLDDGTVPFFNVLRDHLSYYPQKTTPFMTFADMGYAHMYYETGNRHPDTKELRSRIPQWPEQEVEKMEPFIRTFNESGPGFWVRKPIFRNLYRVFRERKMGAPALKKAMGTITKGGDKMFKASHASTKEEFEGAYELLDGIASRVKA